MLSFGISRNGQKIAEWLYSGPKVANSHAKIYLLVDLLKFDYKIFIKQKTQQINSLRCVYFKHLNVLENIMITWNYTP